MRLSRPAAAPAVDASAAAPAVDASAAAPAAGARAGTRHGIQGVQENN